MRREQNIPLFLWIFTAILGHLAWGGGADELAELVDERVDVRKFAESVQRHVRLKASPFEVTLLEETDESEMSARDERSDQGAIEETPSEADETSSTRPEEEEDAPTETNEAEQREPKLLDPDQDPTKPEPDESKPKPDESKPEPKLDPLVEPEPSPARPTLQLDRRVAVEQHVADENQADNPDAEFIGEHANKVDQQTQARLTSADQNDAQPTPGGNFQGPSGEPGNSHLDEVAQSEDSPGEPNRASNDAAKGQEVAATSGGAAKGGNESPLDVTYTNEGRREGRHASGATDDASNAAARGQVARAASPALEASPEIAGGDSAEHVAAAQEERSQQDARQARQRRLPPRKGQKRPLDFLGLGSGGETERGINLNLSHGTAVAVIGREALDAARTADGERRRSKHRGSWRAVGIERWRSAIENYVAAVQPGNQTSLNTAKVPFARYLNHIHNRLHPIFAGGYLGTLNQYPADHPLNRPEMKTDLEIVLSRQDGAVVRMGITRSSGVTMFDVAALESVQQASPFGSPPGEIVSPDGNVYLHWEFYRDPRYACSTYFARPYLLKVKPKSTPMPAPPGTAPFAPEEHPPGTEQHGHLLPFAPHDAIHAEHAIAN